MNIDQSAAGLPPFASEYLDCFERSWTDRTRVELVRFVVLDTETTGLDARRDRLITIGAVAVRAGEIILGDSFEAMMKIAYNTSSVTVHGITRDEAREGLDESEAIESFIAYLRDGVIVGHHIGHDVEALNCACARRFGFSLKNRALDTMDLTLNLQQDGALAGGHPLSEFSLDALCEFFGVAPRDRHTAGGDAFMTALIFLKLLKVAQKFGRRDLGSLSEPSSLCRKPAGEPN
jgi:DNA polymerase-3 subunit epsilon